MKDSEEDLLYRLLGGIVVLVACIIVVFAAYLMKAVVMTTTVHMASGGSHILCVLALAAGTIACPGGVENSRRTERIRPGCGRRPERHGDLRSGGATCRL